MLLEGHPELVSGSHRDPISMPYRGQMLKRVQDDNLHWTISFVI